MHSNAMDRWNNQLKFGMVQNIMQFGQPLMGSQSSIKLGVLDGYSLR